MTNSLLELRVFEHVDCSECNSLLPLKSEPLITSISIVEG